MPRTVFRCQAEACSASAGSAGHSNCRSVIRKFTPPEPIDSTACPSTKAGDVSAAYGVEGCAVELFEVALLDQGDATDVAAAVDVGDAFVCGVGNGPVQRSPESCATAFGHPPLSGSRAQPEMISRAGSLVASGGDRSAHRGGVNRDPVGELTFSQVADGELQEGRDALSIRGDESETVQVLEASKMLAIARSSAALNSTSDC